MADTLAYGFGDDGQYVYVKLEVSPDTTADDISVVTSGDSLTVLDKRQPKPLIAIVQLRAPVDSGATTWELSPEHELLIKLVKQHDVPWPALTPDASPNPKEEAPSPAGALEARKQVEALLSAAKAGDVAAFDGAALQFPGYSLGQVKDANGRTALHFAAKSNAEMVRHLLVDYNMDVDALDDAGETPLALAAAGGDYDIAKLLVENGADVRLAGSDSPEPICRAASSGNVDLLKLLLENGATVEAGSISGTPLLWASGSGSSPCVDALLEAGANPDAQGPDNTSAVLMAAATENAGAVRSLVKAGARVDVVATGGVTALHVAAENGDAEIVKILLEAGADPNVEDGGGHKPIVAAATNGFREVVELLLPMTTPVPDKEWTVDAVIERAQAYIDDVEVPSSVMPRQGSIELVDIPPPQEPNEVEAGAQKRAGDEAYARGDYPAALESYTASLRHDTSDTKVWANRAAAALKLGEFELAVADCKKARTLKPDNIKAWYREGSALENLGRWEEAAQAYFEGLRVDPEHKELAVAFNHAVSEGRKQSAQASKPPAST